MGILQQEGLKGTEKICNDMNKFSLFKDSLYKNILYQIKEYRGCKR